MRVYSGWLKGMAGLGLFVWLVGKMAGAGTVVPVYHRSWMEAWRCM